MDSYFAYTRVSTKKQGEKGVSLDEQRDAIARYAKANGLSVGEWLEERETAAKGGRPVFSQMLDRLRNREAAGVIIHKIDRSARNLKDWADLGVLIDRGVDVHFAHEAMDLASRGGRLSADIQAIVAADYIRNLRSEIRKGMYGRLKQGLYPLGAPVGYLDQGKGKPKVPDPTKAPLVRQLFEVYATGAHTLHTLRKVADEIGFTNLRGGRISINGLSTILNNPFYCGVIRMKSTGETFKGIHKPIVSTALFDHVQDVLCGRVSARPVKHDFLLRRLLRCRRCGYTLIGERQKGYIYYRCHTRRCRPTSIREDDADKQIGLVFAEVQLTRCELTELRKLLDKRSKTWGVDRTAMVEGAKLDVDRLKQRAERLTDALVDGALDQSVFNERRQRLVVDIRAAEKRVEALQSLSDDVQREMAKILEQLESLQRSYERGVPFERRDLITEVTSNRLLAGKNLAVELHEPFRTVANRPKFSSSTPLRERTRTLDSLFETLWQYACSQVSAGQQ